MVKLTAADFDKVWAVARQRRESMQDVIVAVSNASSRPRRAEVVTYALGEFSALGMRRVIFPP